ncbi:hypothetical protein QQS21_011633 [Conoideocrella luteorostrata]|uniref:Uncharacterized protein n=1 Tax=Conoideocrella luteorostrata TaxID=1105319 RepID=A0AAJ0CF28_9HYPO|nr:hypothetical protein QQS21_011633 [Conoideocrella luteorostrata]
MDIIFTTLACLGAALMLYMTYVAFDFLSLHFLLPSRPLQVYKRSGPDPTYALITGGSAGIGLGIAQELIRQGFGVVLLGHLADELAQTEKALRRAWPSASVYSVVMDAQTATGSELDVMIERLNDYQISILVNNVGGCPIAPPTFRTLGDYSCRDIDALINQNTRFMAQLTARMMPTLSRGPAQPGERSLIINMSSGACVGVPYQVMYSACKAFNLSLSCGLARELGASSSTNHIDCIALNPGDVHSQGNCRGLPRNTPKWDEFGSCAVKTIDGAVRRNMRTLSPYWLHDLQQRILPYLSEAFLSRELGETMSAKKRVWDAHDEKSR